MAWLSQTLEDQSITIHRLRKIFGFKTERTSDLPAIKPEDNSPKTNSDSDSNDGEGNIEENPDNNADGKS